VSDFPERFHLKALDSFLAHPVAKGVLTGFKIVDDHASCLEAAMHASACVAGGLADKTIDALMGAVATASFAVGTPLAIMAGLAFKVSAGSASQHVRDGTAHAVQNLVDAVELLSKLPGHLPAAVNAISLLRSKLDEGMEAFATAVAHGARYEAGLSQTLARCTVSAPAACTADDLARLAEGAADGIPRAYHRFSRLKAVQESGQQHKKAMQDHVKLLAKAKKDFIEAQSQLSSAQTQLDQRDLNRAIMEQSFMDAAQRIRYGQSADAAPLAQGGAAFHDAYELSLASCAKHPTPEGRAVCFGMYSLLQHVSDQHVKNAR
jgi:hypothetical protein